LLAVLAYAVPPLRLIDAGFGEFTLAVHVAVIATAIGFALQGGEYHRVVGIVSFPLTLLALAYFLILDFPTFANDEKYDRRTLLRSISWERAVPLHHGLVLGAYILLGSALLFGLAWDLIWPSLLTLPFAVFQIIQLRNISLGVKPVWNLLTVNALAVFGLTAYLLAFAFWLR
jgi:1,4-dihydroxy-2-naphthoate octaprenyltransferase